MSTSKIGLSFSDSDDLDREVNDTSYIGDVSSDQSCLMGVSFGDYLGSSLPVAGGVGFCATDSSTVESIVNSSQMLSTSDSSLSKLAYSMCSGYGFDAYFCQTYVSDYSFFHEHAVECGYELSKDFSLKINDHKIGFSDAVSSFLEDDKFFSRTGRSLFSYDKNHNKSITIYVCCFDLDCSYFYESVRRYRPKVIKILVRDFIPRIIKTISRGMVIDSSGSRSMTYHEMEMLFLNFVTKLEMLIVKIMMSYWHSHLDDIESVLSLLSSSDCGFAADHTNPFCRLRNCNKIREETINDVAHPVAFVDVYGVTISLIAKHKIDVFSEGFIHDFCNSLKVILHDKIMKISNHSSYDYDNDFKVFSDVELPLLIEESFNKAIVSLQCDLSNFLRQLAVWAPPGVDGSFREVDFSKFIENIKSAIYSLLKVKVCSISDSFINIYTNKINNFLSRMKSKVSTYMIDRWGVNLHHKFDYNYSSIRKKFSPMCKSIVNKKFREMILGGFSASEWKYVSSKLLPIAMKLVSGIYKNEYDELKELVSNTHVVKRDGTFVKLDETYKTVLCVKIMSRINKEFRDFVRLCWIDVVNSTNIPTPLPDSAGSSSCPESAKGDHCYSSEGVGSQVVNVESHPVCEGGDVQLNELGNLFESFMDRLVSDGNYSVMRSIEELMGSSSCSSLEILPDQSVSGRVFSSDKRSFSGPCLDEYSTDSYKKKKK
ncbi:hypothetical protein Ark11_0889 [Candidatus Ichthyocystis hellenicum]|uniref:Uncharacterized protein n=2 Tax=Candidatus Ichthyocystis TaxID=2929841 RepID=A0A0S4M3A9_9BURK|nr:hypothetical protein [Candidatus Ichthyocystis hellenicum]CUT17712.1 hypothetical protein Ark11_0889 [Candidatus Ichthyocystis hellenicum]